MDTPELLLIGSVIAIILFITWKIWLYSSELKQKLKITQEHHLDLRELKYDIGSEIDKFSEKLQKISLEKDKLARKNEVLAEKGHELSLEHEELVAQNQQLNERIKELLQENKELLFTKSELEERYEATLFALEELEKKEGEIEEEFEEEEEIDKWLEFTGSQDDEEEDGPPLEEMTMPDADKASTRYDQQSTRWSSWLERIHKRRSQILRQERAFDFPIQKIHRGNGTARSTGNRYKTTLLKCTCPDFKRRKLPCKHMYRLAHELEIIDLSDVKTE